MLRGVLFQFPLLRPGRDLLQVHTWAEIYASCSASLSGLAWLSLIRMGLGLADLVGVDYPGSDELGVDEMGLDRLVLN